MGTRREGIEGLSFRVSDLKQYFFCPRVVYYHTCLPDVRPTTFKMQVGREEGLAERHREERRSLRAYGLRAGECFFDLSLSSPRLCLHGRLDMAIRTADNALGALEAIPVDYKLTPGRTVAHFILQVVAYGMLLEEAWQIPVHRGFLYLIPSRRAREIEMTQAPARDKRGQALRDQVSAAVEAMTRIAVRELMPEPPRRKEKCRICEFRRFCNDVV